MINLTSYEQIRTASFVRIDVPDYAVLRFSDYATAYTIDGESYDTLGALLGITSTSSDLRASPGEVTVTISGIPNARLTEIMGLKIKGSSVEIRRGFFNAVTAQPISIPGNGGSNVIGRFVGRVMNFAIQEDYDNTASSSTVSIQFSCSSVVDLLSNKVAGRQTNDTSEKSFYPTDTSMDRVLSLANSNFNFGAPL